MESIASSPQCLEGYKPVEWPDLSGRRNPPSTVYHSSSPLSPGFFISSPRFHASVLVAIGRITAVYCGVSDVLLCARLGHGNRAIRVNWGDGETWNQVICSVEKQLEGSKDDGVADMGLLRDTLGLKMPCLAMYSTSSTLDQTLEVPFAISLDKDAFSFHLTAKESNLHRSFSSLLLDQLKSILEFIPLHGGKPMSSLPDLPSNLLSVCDSNPSDLSSKPPPKYATDYLSIRASTWPRSTAFFWYAEPPQSPSALSPSDSMSYFDWHVQSNKFARWLVNQGLQKDEKVAVSMVRDRHYHIAIMGIMRAGLCYVPIDPELPPERKRYIVSDSKAPLVLTTKNISELSLFGDASVYVEESRIQAEIEAQASDDLDRASPDCLAYLLYTSGTTGNPKGCLMTHECLSEAIWAIAGIASQTKDAGGEEEEKGKYLATASIAFDVHLAEVFVPLALGIPLYNIPRSTLLENLPYYVVELGITHLALVPSLMEATLSVAQSEGDLSGFKLRYICSGGEKITDTILDTWADHHRLCLANFYGPSEVTIGCCARIMDSTTPKSNIGRTFSNVSGYVVDENMNIVPRGGVGELVVGGPLVGRGYQGRQDLTNKVFLEWPHEGNRVYRTGDLVRMMPDCTFEILGRIDTQIKLRGVRIESEGISSIVRSAFPSSSGFSLDAMTILASHPKIGTDQLVSFIAWDSSVSVSTRKASTPSVARPPAGLLQNIKAKCDAELASYMRPSHIVPLTYLPLSSNGKADAKALARIFLGLDLNVLVSLSPHSAAHGEPAAHSSTTPTVLAQPSSNGTLVESFSKVWLPEVSQPYPADDIECVLPAFPAQEGVLSRSAVDNTLYVQTVILACKPATTVTMLKQAWESIVVRHPILRSVFFFSRSLVQVVFKPSVYPLPWEEKQIPTIEESHFSHWFETNEATRVAQSINDNASERPLFRLTAYLSASRTYLACSIHHSLFDGTSLPILLEEVDHVCLGIPVDPAASLSEVRNAISATDLGQAERFWRTMYEGFTWPSPISATTSTGWSGRVIPFKTPLIKMRHLAAQAQVTLQAYLARAFAEILAVNLYSQDDITLGIIRSGRLRPIDGLEKVVCPMISVQPLRIRLQQADVLNAIQKSLLDTIEYEHVGLGQIHGWIRPGLPMFDAVFSLAVKAPEDHQSFDILVSTNPVPDFPLAVEILLENDSLSIRAAWIHGAIAENVMGHILDTFEATALGNAPLSSPSGSTSTLCDADTSLRLGHPNTTYSPLPTELTNRLRSEISQFLGIAEALIQDDTSLISLGLDSLKSVGLSRVLRRGGLDVSATQLMSRATVRELVGVLRPPTNPEGPALAKPTDTARLRSIVSQFLGVNESIVGDDVSLISLGLDSLKSVGLSRTLRREGWAISATQLMSMASIRKLAALVSGETVVKVERDVMDDFEPVFKIMDTTSLQLAPEDHVRCFPVTDLQTGMLSQTVASRGDLYVHAFPLLLSPHLDIPRIHEAWKHAVGLLSILRTTFHFSAELAIWFQAVHSFESLDWSTDSFSSEVDYTRKVSGLMESLQLIDELAFRRPPWRICCYTSSSSPSDRRLVLVMHHALYDGISIEKLLSTLAALYNSETIPPIVHFVDILPTLRKQEIAGTNFWLSTLRGYSKVDLPRISTIPLSDEPHKVTKTVQFNPSSLNALVGNMSVTIQCVAQAALAKVLSSTFRTSDVLFGHVVSGRSIPQGEDTIGPLLTTIPCRVPVSEGVADPELLKAVHAWNIAALPHQHLSLRALQKSMNVKTLWDVLFVFQPLLPPDDESEKLWTFDNSMGEEAKVQYPWTIEVHQHEDYFFIGGACRPDYMSASDFAASIHLLGDLIANFITPPTPPAEAPATLTVTPSAAPFGDSDHKLSLLITLLAGMTGLSAANITSLTPLTALGVDSITAIQLAARARKQGLHILASDISSSGTVGDLVQSTWTGQTHGHAPTPLIKVDITVTKAEADAIRAEFGWGPDLIESVTVASAGIKWLAGAWQRSGGARFQHVFAYRIPINIDPIKLRRAWFTLVARHAILRSTIACEEGCTEPRLVSFKAESFTDHWSEEKFPSREFYRRSLERMKELVSRPPGLSRPPTRAKLLTSRKFKCLVLHLHHFQYDAWSLRLLMEDLSQLYSGGNQLASNDLNAFLAYSIAGANALQVQKAYWRSMFPPNFRTAFFPRQNYKTTTSKRVIVTLPSALAKASLFEQRAKDIGVSLQAIFLACWAQLQAQYTAHDEATFGMWHSGRRGALNDIESLAVPCMNVLPFRIGGISTMSILRTAKLIEEELRRRTDVIEQSDLTRVDEWIGGKGRALCNVFVNIVKVSPDLDDENALFEPIHAPYWVPDKVEDSCELPRFAVTDLIRDDLLVDIVMLEKQDSILMSVDASATLMDVGQAAEAIERWAILVKGALGIV